MKTEEQRAVQVVRLGTLTVYEISDEELRLIAAGDPSSVLLNFGVGSLSLGIGIGATLLAGTIESRAIFDLLVILTVVGILAGVVLLILWRRQAKQMSSVVQTVRERGKTQFTATSVTVTTREES